MKQKQNSDECRRVISHQRGRLAAMTDYGLFVEIVLLILFELREWSYLGGAFTLMLPWRLFRLCEIDYWWII
nr:hypothetical protein [Tanacetum cinerariifolium]